MLLSCSKDDDKQPVPVCDTFTSADSVCFCRTHAENVRCNTFKLSVFSKVAASLTPSQTNGTIWSKGFVIDHSIYIIDRESNSPHTFLKLDVQKNEGWEVLTKFPGTDYGLTGSANGKGYASSYASKKFWEYDPVKNEWTPLTDLPFSTIETHWVEYNGKFYVPNHDGIFEFNASTKEWNKISTQTSSGFGAIFLVGDDMYWYNINDTYMSRFNFVDKSYEKVNVPDDFNISTAFNSPFVIDGVAMVVYSRDLWMFDAVSKTWSVKKNAIKSGSAYGDDVFVIDEKPYLIYDGNVLAFEAVE
jgi:hypothetical protein